MVLWDGADGQDPEGPLLPNTISEYSQSLATMNISCLPPCLESQVFPVVVLQDMCVAPGVCPPLPWKGEGGLAFAEGKFPHSFYFLLDGTADPRFAN